MARHRIQAQRGDAVLLDEEIFERVRTSSGDSASYQQKESSVFVYPKRAWRKLFMEFPPYFWHMGLE
jgi:hypothetical protein